VTATSEFIGRSPGGRKLIAVVYADMVGYSRLIGLDDVGTLERLRALRSEVIDPAINEYGGRIVQTGGDSLLIVFRPMSQWASAQLGRPRCLGRLRTVEPA
jgi:class 3 adenylate cyclase